MPQVDFTLYKRNSWAAGGGGGGVGGREEGTKATEFIGTSFLF